MAERRAREGAPGVKQEEREAASPGYRGAAPAPISAPTWKRRLFIDRPADLRAFVSDLETATVLAIDAEFVQNYQRRTPEDPAHRLTLLQFALDNDYRVSYVVDALRLGDLSPLAAPLERASLLKLFHGMSSDVRVLASRGLEARHTLDLEAVSRSLFGQRESGLQAMLARAASIHMDKSLQRSDWSRRPLTPAMVAYAARDAEMTYALYGWLSANYPRAIATYETLADEPPPEVAAWIRPYLDTGRGRPVEYALLEAGIEDDRETQARDLRQALGAALRPNRARASCAWSPNSTCAISSPTCARIWRRRPPRSAPGPPVRWAACVIPHPPPPSTRWRRTPSRMCARPRRPPTPCSRGQPPRGLPCARSAVAPAVSGPPPTTPVTPRPMSRGAPPCALASTCPTPAATTPASLSACPSGILAAVRDGGRM